MAQEEARIAFYKIDRCGYYERGKENPKFGNIKEILSELQSWTEDKPLGATCPFEHDDNDSVYPAYCLDISESNKTENYLLTTWNAVPSTENNVASVDGASLVGAPKVEMTELRENAIPGYATYFWFVPPLNVLATICFQHRLNGHPGLNKYLNEFVTKFTRFAVTKENDEHFTILGYKNDNGDKLEQLLPGFRSSLLRHPAKIDFIRKHCADIKKLKRKNELMPNSAKTGSLFKNLLSHLGIEISNEPPESVHFKYEMDFSPSAEELDTIIGSWEQEHNQTKWDDIGFQLRGDPETYWLSHSVVKQVLSLSIKRDNLEVVNAKSLLKELDDRREEILRPVQ